jgi:hypothetical protein
MTSSSKKVVFDRKNSDRIVELRKKINDPKYLDSAVSRIAQVMSKRIVRDTDPYSRKV